MGGEEVVRYQRLGLEEALHRSHQYPYACKELAFLLRHAYSKLPKALQSLLFHHSLTAFRLLPSQGSSGTSAANLLIQASVAVLPKQRKALAVSEFKRAVVAQKRRCKVSQDEGGLVQLPNDVLIHVFSFLDLRSLAVSSLICRPWKIASSEEMLWRSQYFFYFGKTEVENSDISDDGVKYQSKDDSVLAATSCWKQAFTRKITGKSWRFASGRGYCGNCKQVFWLSDLTCTNPHQCVYKDCGSAKIKPISPSKVVEYLLGETSPSNCCDYRIGSGRCSQVVEYLSGETSPTAYSSDSDSDSDGLSFSERRLHKLWAYPMHVDINGMPSVR